jgi:hypothetical protein
MSGYKALPLALLLSACGTTQNATTSSIDPTPHRGTLCSLLERIEPGEVLPVVVSGVYQVAYEAQVLADPTRPPCQRDVQPVTWVELAPNAEGKSSNTVTFLYELEWRERGDREERVEFELPNRVRITGGKYGW